MQPACPLSPCDTAALFHHIAETLGSPDECRCDHSHRIARGWCEARPIEWEPVLAWLQSLGGYCDCEIMLNAAASRAQTGPNAHAYAYRATYVLTHGYSVEFVLSGHSLTVDWQPQLPLREIGLKLLPLYQQARNHFLASLDVPMLVIDL